jgi:DNA-binding XRE family transcriptional regulator
MSNSEYVSPDQCKAARARLGLSQAALAKAAGVAERTVIKFENGGPVGRSTVMALKAVLAAGDVAFVSSDQEEGVVWRRPDGMVAA